MELKELISDKLFHCRYDYLSENERHEVEAEERNYYKSPELQKRKDRHEITSKKARTGTVLY